MKYPIVSLSSHLAHPSLIQIETQSFMQIPGFSIVGLPNTEVDESKERVRSALIQSEFEFPKRKILVNLSPAHLPKAGTGLDLPIALSVLFAHAKPALEISGLILAHGELSLSGELRGEPMGARMLYAASRYPIQKMIFPKTDSKSLQKLLNLFHRSGYFKDQLPELFPVSTLKEAWDALIAPKSSASPNISRLMSEKKQIENSPLLPLSPALSRILSLSAAGHHHLILLGEKGVGKSYSTEWMKYLLPESDFSTQIESLLLRELVAGSQSIQNPRVGSDCRPATLLGSIQRGRLRPGLYSLAHGQILIADELLEWHRDTRESLREPLERHQITLSRAEFHAEVPSQFLLVATGNLCPCGGRKNLETTEGCRCFGTPREQYIRKLSGPVLDRIDLMTVVLRRENKPTETKTLPAQKLKQNVIAAREFSQKTWGKPAGLLSPAEIEDILSQFKKTPEHLSTKNLRSRHKTARIALTIAAFEELKEPLEHHWLEAFHYRPERFEEARSGN